MVDVLNTTNTTTLAGSFPRFVLGAVKEAYDEIRILPCIRSDTLADGQGIQGTYAILPTLASQDVTEGNFMANVAVTHSAINITTVQRGLKLSIIELASRASVLGLSGILANAVRQVTQDVDAKIAALNTTFTTNAREVAATLTSAVVFSALGKVLKGTGNRAMGSGEIFLAIHTRQWASLSADLAANGTPLMATDVLQNVARGTLGTLYGVKFAVTNQIPVAADSNNGREGAMFYRDALCAVFAWEPRTVTQPFADVGGGPGLIATITHASGYAVLANGYGVNISTG